MFKILREKENVYLIRIPLSRPEYNGAILKINGMTMHRESFLAELRNDFSSVVTARNVFILKTQWYENGIGCLIVLSSKRL